MASRTTTNTEVVNYEDDNNVLFRERLELKAVIEELSGRSDLAFEDRQRQHRSKVRLEVVDTALIDFNYGLVKTYVKKFTSNTSREDSRDFEGAAVVGLMRAIATYDPARGRFSTWAYKPIQREVLRAVRDADYPNMNPGDFEKRPEILKARAELQGGDDSYEPSSEEIAVLAHTTVEQVKRVLDAPDLESLSKPVGEDGDTHLGDLLEDPGVAIEDAVVTAREIEDLERYGLSCLDERELFVIVRRYGLDCEPEQRLSTIGSMLGLSREAVRQVEGKALSKLSHPTILRKLVRHGRP